MGYDYGFEYVFPDAVAGAAEGVVVGAAGILMGVLLIVYLLAMAFSIVCYILHAVGLYRIAKRRGIHHAWLAWVPIAEVWLLGSVADHYQYVAKHNTTKRRKVLLTLYVITYILMIALFALLFSVISFMQNDAAMAGEIGLTAVMVVVSLAVEGVAIAATVFCYIAYFDLFRSCKPKYDVLFLVLGIIFPMALPFFVFACCGADEGMPARRVQQPPVQIPYQPEAPAEAPETPAQDEIPVVEAEVVEDPE